MLNVKQAGIVGRLPGALIRCPWKLFVLSQSLSTIGSWATRVAISWLVFRLSGSVFLCGVIAFAGQIAILLLAPLAGYALDHFRRRNIVLLTQCLLFVQASVLAAVACSEQLSVAAIVVLSVTRGVIVAFDLPARQALLGDLAANDEDTKKALALDGLQINVGRLLGPVIAGVLIPLSGEGLCFVCDSLSYLFALTGLLMIPVPPGPRQAAPQRENKTGRQFLGGPGTEYSLWRPLLLLGTASFFCVPFTVLLPQYVHDLLNRGPGTLSLLIGVSGAGAITATIVVYVLKKIFISIRFIQINSALSGFFLLLLSREVPFVVAVVAVFLLSFFIMVQIASTATLVQTASSPVRRGRLSSLYGVVFWGVVPSGSLVYGASAQWLGPGRTLALAGLGCLAVVVGTCMWASVFSFFEKNDRVAVLNK